MKVTGDEAKTVAAAAREVAPILKQMGDGDLAQMLGAAFTEVGKTLQGVEARILEAGLIPGDILVILLHYGALVAVLEDLPPGDERRTLIAAGRKLGEFMAKKYGDKIRSLLERATPPKTQN